MTYGNYRSLSALKNQLYEAWNDWADKRDDATNPAGKRQARFVARNLEEALCKVEKAMEIAKPTVLTGFLSANGRNAD